MRRYTLKKELMYWLITVIFVTSVTLIIGEFMVRVINPVPSLYPRWEYSPEYGHIMYPNVTMVDEVPGQWKFTYYVNKLGYRGAVIPISNKYEKKNIVILGDSNAFGQGVNDGEEFPAVMAEQLKDRYDVINLSVAGYGLPQQIRRYYEFGQLYHPTVIILQFSANDLSDGFYNRVTETNNGMFEFKTINRPEGWLKRYLSKSIIQKSQLYNFFRYRAFLFFEQQYLKKFYNDHDVASTDIQTAQETFYSELLDTFANDLSQQGIRLMIFAPYDRAINRFPLIKEKVTQLSSDGRLEHIQVDPWLENRAENYPPSLEGHPLGKEAHYQIGYKFAEYLDN